MRRLPTVALRAKVGFSISSRASVGKHGIASTAVVVLGQAAEPTDQPFS
jgi:hypothetical protein